jgi:hypothetical protein
MYEYAIATPPDKSFVFVVEAMAVLWENAHRYAH